MKHGSQLLVAAALVLAAAVSAAGANAKPVQQILDDVQRRLAQGTHEQRTFARSELEDAARSYPGNRDIAIALGRLYYEADMLREARRIAEPLVARDSTDADAQFLTGLVWRREWLTQADDVSRDRAIVYFAHGMLLAPRDVARWRPLVPMLVDAGEVPHAHVLAMSALHGAPSDPPTQAVAAMTAQMTGNLDLAGRLFARAIPRLPERWRERYDDLRPMLPPWEAEVWEGMSRSERLAEVTRFWRVADPDPVTPENEARLEFDARVTHAWLAYGMVDDTTWDMRAQLYIRFGPPAMAERNSMVNRTAAMNGNWLLWTYPELGMRVWMEAANPMGHYRNPFSFYPTALTMPYADSVAHRTELDAVRGGWALFRRLPVNVQPLDVQCVVAHFEGDEGPRLLAQAEAPGEPAARLTAQWAVLDTGFAVVARSTDDMSASACRPAEARASSFTSALPPGRYRVGLHVTDEFGHRGVATRDVVVPAQAGGLALSDLVITCGTPEMSVVPGTGVRLEPETGLYPANSDPLNAYFEIYHLDTDLGGQATFEYVCTVRSAEHDRRPWISRALLPRPSTPSLEMSRREVTVGPMRRQFLSVPLRGLPAGRYELEVRVRDVASGEESRTMAEFARRD